jgi:hypothetical protein
MTRTLLVATALLACACNRDAQRPANPNTSASTASAPAPQPTSTAGTANATITLVGCLQDAGRFTLTNASAESRDTASAPAIETGSSVALVDVPAEARANLNKQVRVTGHLDAARADAGARTAAPSGGSASTRDDVRANSTTVASDTPEHGRDARLIVERVQAIAETCAAR